MIRRRSRALADIGVGTKEGRVAPASGVLQRAHPAECSLLLGAGLLLGGL